MKSQKKVSQKKAVHKNTKEKKEKSPLQKYLELREAYGKKMDIKFKKWPAHLIR